MKQNKFLFSDNSRSDSNLFGEKALKTKLSVERKNKWFDFVIPEQYGGNPINEHFPITDKQLGDIIPRWNWKIFFILLIFILLSFAARAWYLELLYGSDYRLQAEENRVRIVELLPTRGKIFDRNGIIIADNKPLFLLTIEGYDWLKRTSEEQTAIINTLREKGIDIEKEWLDKELKSKPRVIISELTYSEALSFMALTSKLGGVDVAVSARREYKDPFVFSHVLGYLAPITSEQLSGLKDEYLINDYIGQVGIELEYENRLRGKLGQKSIEVDANGKEAKVVFIKPPVNGNDINLTIDAEMQEQLYDIMKRHFTRRGLAKGAAVVMNPSTGEVYSLISFPSYNTQSFYQGLKSSELADVFANKDKPLFNRATSGQYPPGSTFKAVVAVAGLEDGIITPNTSFMSSGGIRVSEWFFPDWKAGGHGITNLYKAIAESVNTYFYIVGGGFEDREGVGVERISEKARVFGLSQKTGIDFPEEETGFLPSKSWKESTKNERWYIGDTYNLSIGQGDVLVTPLQMASLYASIANNGLQFKPHLLKQEANTNNGNAVISENNAKILKGALRQTVLLGSAQRLNSAPIAVSGKTGTAEWNSNKNPHAWFIGYAPAENPLVVIAIVVEEGGEGSSTAVPIAEDFFTWYGRAYTMIEK